MTILRKKADVFVHEHLCPECEKAARGDFALRYTGDDTGRDPNGKVLFGHKCPACGYSVRLDRQFPDFNFETIPDSKPELIEEKRRIVRV